MEKNTNQGKYSASQSYLNSTHRLGRVSSIIAVLLILMVPAASPLFTAIKSHWICPKQ